MVRSFGHFLYNDFGGTFELNFIWFVKVHFIKAKLLYMFQVQTTCIMKRKAEILDDYDRMYFFVMFSLTQ